jgi:hypothetical protein
VARIVTVCVIVALAAAALATTARSGSTGTPIGTFNGCPHDTRPIPERIATVERPLRIAVLQFVRTSFRHITNQPSHQLVGARVRFIILVRHWLPSGWIKRECGLTVWRNSVAVDVYFPRLDKPHNPVGHCNDCAHLTFLTALTRGDWAVWGDY